MNAVKETLNNDNILDQWLLIIPHKRKAKFIDIFRSTLTGD